MVESIQWLHINEAVRVYNKTRQTFYNRIKKGYVKTKKVHNKVYISSDDIEYMLSEYLEEVDQTEKNAYIDDLQSSEKEKNNQIP